jgi:hypothetical protein
MLGLAILPSRISQAVRLSPSSWGTTKQAPSFPQRLKHSSQEEEEEANIFEKSSSRALTVLKYDDIF